MSDSKKDRRDVKEIKRRGSGNGKGWTRERARFDDDEEFDWKKYTGNIKEIKLDDDEDKE